MQERVRFFSKEDLSLSYYLRMAEGVVDEYNNGRVPLDANDYLEMYQITLFVENGICSDKWDEVIQKQITSKNLQFFKVSFLIFRQKAKL